MRILLTTLILALVCAMTLHAAETNDIVVADFEGNTYGDWKTTGTAFGPGPAQGTLPGQMEVTGFHGYGLANSFYGGDDATGTLTSPPFTIERKYLNFLIGGGMRPGEACINLLVQGRVVRTATGPNDKPGGTEKLSWQTWDVSEFQGRSVRIEIVDRATGGWGHITVDWITMSNEKRAETIRTDVLYDESYRPQFHFTPMKNWMNDPNGLVYYGGEYHLFFQHNPSGINWGNMTWGHATSLDLVHWKQLPNAIEPDKLGTIFSGSAVVDEKNTAGFQVGNQPALVAIYTAAGGTSPESQGQPFTQCLAYSTDKGQTWTKYAQNPVLKHIAAENRDPKVVWHAPTQHWIMALYLDKEDYALFSSQDLKAWTQLQTLTMPGCSECPDFFEIPVTENPKEHKWVFTAANGHYLVGDFDGKRFTPEGGVQQVDYGANYYAVQTYSDIPSTDGRRIQIAWMTGGSYPQMPFNQQMSFPCTLTLHTTPDGLRLYRLPIRELAGLHSGPLQWRNHMVQPGENLLKIFSGELWDIQMECELQDATEFGLRVRGEDIRYHVKEQTLTCLGRTAPLAPENGRIKLRILVDRTSLEVFGNEGKISMTSCFVPRLKEKGLELYAIGGNVKVVSMVVSPLRSAWTQRGARIP
ncbi:MAG TPA: glycoside hydrolase family 32 protein [Chthonomonadaceae bacterium]|nr:glycoside hydrolase family 32 protein [Chthonomonadaceae bacterium]